MTCDSCDKDFPNIDYLIATDTDYGFLCYQCFKKIFPNQEPKRKLKIFSPLSNKIIFFKIVKKNLFNHTNNIDNSIFQLIHDYKANFYKLKTGNYIFINELKILEITDYYIKCKFNYLDDERYFIDHIHYKDLINYYYWRVNSYSAYKYLQDNNITFQEPKQIIQRSLF